MTDDVGVEITVSGRVQGVGYRYWARNTAQGLGLRGVVRNRGDGTVEAVVAGPAERIDAFAEACRAGPAEAAVSAVARRDVPADLLPQDGGMTIARDG